MSNLLKVLFVVLLLGGCASIDTENYPENWGKINLKGTTLINGSFECKGESKSNYFRNVNSDSFLPYLFDVDSMNYRKCTSVSIMQVDVSSLTITINYDNKVLTKTLINETDYEYKDGWYYFSRKSTRPFSFGADGVGTKRVSFSLNSSDKLVTKISRSGIGLFLMLPLVEVSDEWNIFSRN